MSIIKKIAAGLLALTMMMSFSACSDTSWAGKVDNYQVNAGVYIYYTLIAYNSAQSKAGVEETSESDDSVSETTTAATTTGTTTQKQFFAARIDGKDVKTWIQDTATDDVKNFVAIEKEFDELGLALTDTDKTQINTSLEQAWSYNSALFEKNGIGKESMKQIITSSYKSNHIFKSYYGEGGTEEVLQDTINSYLDENNARVKYIAIQLKDGEGNLFKSADKAKAMERAEDYKERAKTESFDTLIQEYNDYYEKLVEEATKDDSSSSSSEESSTAEEPQNPYANESILSKDGTIPSEKINKAIFEKTKVGEVSIIEDNEVYYVVQRLDLLERTDLIESNSESILYTLKSEEFEAKIQEYTDSLNYEKNENSYKRYDPKDLYFG